MARRKAAAPVATFQAPVKVSAEDRKGPSTCDNPVGVTWVVCINSTVDGAMVARKEQMALAIEAGVGYNTARTQVQKFRKWHNGGSLEADLPRGITIE